MPQRLPFMVQRFKWCYIGNNQQRAKGKNQEYLTILHWNTKVFAKYPMMNGPEFVALRKAANLFSNDLDESDNVNTDWQDLLYRNGIVTDHSISW